MPFPRNIQQSPPPSPPPPPHHHHLNTSLHSHSCPDSQAHTYTEMQIYKCLPEAPLPLFPITRNYIKKKKSCGVVRYIIFCCCHK